MKKQICFIFLIYILSFYSCEPTIDHPLANGNTEGSNNISPPQSSEFFYGADLSYVNEMEDCSALFIDVSNSEKDVFQIFDEAGANLARFRLWHNPTWTNYSNLQDVKQSIQRAKSKDMKVLLDFHYSDTWADPGSQEIPAAWLPQLNNTNALGQLLYDYTYNSLNELNSEGLLPDIVQIGNETNGNIVTQGDPFPLDWNRNSSLLNKSIQAVRDLSNTLNKNIEIMLHIAQPENGLWWFEQATQNGVIDYDWIGLSYYPQFSDYTLDNIGDALTELINTYDKKLMIVEVAYPFTLNNDDSASNNLNASSLLPNFPATQSGQLDFLNTLVEKVESSGGSGVVYWEPAWVSTGCSTLWAIGSHWDNATLFDFEAKSNYGMYFFNKSCKNLFPPSDIIINSHTSFTQGHYPTRIQIFEQNPIEEGDIVLLGDSLTEQGEEWEGLSEEGVIKNRGIAGDNTDGLSVRLNELMCANPSTVFVMIGTNDLWTSYTEQQVADKIHAIGTVLAKGLPDSQIYVQTVMPVGESNTSLKPRLDNINTNLREFQNTSYDLLETNLEMANDSGFLPNTSTTDGVHLTNEGYLQWVEFLMTVL